MTWSSHHLQWFSPSRPGSFATFRFIAAANFWAFRLLSPSKYFHKWQSPVMSLRFVLWPSFFFSYWLIKNVWARHSGSVSRVCSALAQSDLSLLLYYSQPRIWLRQTGVCARKCACSSLGWSVSSCPYETGWESARRAECLRWCRRTVTEQGVRPRTSCSSGRGLKNLQNIAEGPVSSAETLLMRRENSLSIAMKNWFGFGSMRQ